jgi:hypothetical protein
MFAEFVRACDKELKLILTFTKYYPRAQEEDEAKVELDTEADGESLWIEFKVAVGIMTLRSVSSFALKEY